MTGNEVLRVILRSWVISGALLVAWCLVLWAFVIGAGL